jgi:hypothetical protein
MVDQKGSLGFVGDVFEVMAQVDRRLTKVNSVDQIIRVNQPGRKPGASQLRLSSRTRSRQVVPSRKSCTISDWATLGSSVQRLEKRRMKSRSDSPGF